jgi:hypothetical protein
MLWVIDDPDAALPWVLVGRLTGSAVTYLVHPADLPSPDRPTPMRLVSTSIPFDVLVREI